MGAFLLAAGAKGKRFALPNSRVMIHQPLGGARGQASDIEIQAREILYLQRAPEQHRCRKSPASPSRSIARDTDRDNFMSGDDAQAYWSGRPGASQASLIGRGFGGNSGPSRRADRLGNDAVRRTSAERLVCSTPSHLAVNRRPRPTAWRMMRTAFPV